MPSQLNSVNNAAKGRSSSFAGLLETEAVLWKTNFPSEMVSVAAKYAIHIFRTQKMKLLTLYVEEPKGGSLGVMSRRVRLRLLLISVDYGVRGKWQEGRGQLNREFYLYVMVWRPRKWFRNIFRGVYQINGTRVVTVLDLLHTIHVINTILSGER